MTKTQKTIRKVLRNLTIFLLEKNKRYGDSAISPIHVFSKLPAESQLCNRIDDKLKRVQNSSELRKNDIVDIIGYLVLLLVKKNWIEFEDLLD